MTHPYAESRKRARKRWRQSPKGKLWDYNYSQRPYVKAKRKEKYIQHADEIFTSALGPESGSDTPKLVSIIKSSVTEDERDSPLVNKICRVAIGMLQIEPDKRLDPDVAIADF